MPMARLSWSMDGMVLGIGESSAELPLVSIPWGWQLKLKGGRASDAPTRALSRGRMSPRGDFTAFADHGRVNFMHAHCPQLRTFTPTIPAEPAGGFRSLPP